MEINDRGSEWRRWDLHIHTPGTVRNSQYSGSTSDEQWENFYKAIEDYVGDGSDPERAVAVVGITDYLSLDSYNKVIADNKLPDCVKLVLPNVECRLQILGCKSPVNIHFIFSPDIVESLGSRFFSRLKFKYDREYSAIKSELIELGKAYLSDSVTNTDDEEAYQKGNKSFALDINNVIDIFKSDLELREKTIIVLAGSNNDGIAGIDNRGRDDQMQMTRRLVCMLADALFTSNENDRKYYLGLGVDDKNTIIERYRSLKPCFHGSDAHKLEEIFNPDNNKYCWIKADTTFEGLKQTLYEPEERVTIQKEYPSNHDAHHVIDYIQFDDKDFPRNKIVFNESLNCIIGGKSTGKSLLLRSLAHSIDSKYANEQELSVPSRANKDLNIRAKVMWKDGTDVARKIVYIPQTYLNSLIDKPEENSEINKIVFDVLIKKDKNVREAYNNFTDKKKNINNRVHNSIMQYQGLISELEAIGKQIVECGSPEIYEKSITDLTTERKALMESFHLEPEEIERYGTLEKERANIKNRQSRMEQEIENLRSLKTPQITMYDESVFMHDVLEQNVPLSSKTLVDFLNSFQNYLEEQWKAKIDLLIQYYEAELVSIQKILMDSEAEYGRLKYKMVSNSKIDVLNTKIEQEQSKLETTKFLASYKQKKIEEINKCINAIINSQEEYYQIYHEFADLVNCTINNGPNTSLAFKAKIVWKKTEFEKMLASTLDNRKLASFAQKRDYDLTNLQAEAYGRKLLQELWNAVFCVDSEVKLSIKGSYKKQAFLQQLFGDWYNVHYEVKSGNDVIEEMSPGKKALVLLELLISLETEKCPILIDQPEDDLDNRSIYNELVGYLKKTKHLRQVILVTHNANVVLGADAEEIIVANQDGVGTNNLNARFEYRSGAIENGEPITDGRGHTLNGVLYETGIQTQICDILEGGKLAFDLRKQKYISVKCKK